MTIETFDATLNKLMERIRQNRDAANGHINPVSYWIMYDPMVHLLTLRLFYVVCFVSRFRLRIGHSSNTKLRGNLIMVVAVVAAIGTAVGAVWGLATTDNGLTVIENDTQEITDDLRAVRGVRSTHDARAALC